MFVRLFGASPVFRPLIQEARDRQRRRRVALAQIGALAAVLGLAMAAAHRGGGAATIAFDTASDGATAAQADVRAVIVQYDDALAAGNFARACSLVDPAMGMTTVRASTADVGVSGTCEQRLAAVVRIAGQKLVSELGQASIPSVEIGGSESSGFTAAASIRVADDVVRRNTWAPVVGVAKSAPGGKVLITCPPLLCAYRFLNELRAQQRARSRSARL